MVRSALTVPPLALLLKRVICALRHEAVPTAQAPNLPGVCGAAGDDLLQDVHARVYVAELPPKYNLHTIAKEGCEDTAYFREVLANPLGPLYESSLDQAQYRCGSSRPRS